MSNVVTFVFSFTVPEDRQARYEEVIAEQLRISATEPGTLDYEIYQSGDGTYCQFERYEDEAACSLHVTNTAPQLQEWTEIVEVKQITAMGPLSADFIKQFNLEQHFLPYAAQ